MELPNEYLKVGASINIKRTDGRIHSAVVAAIDNENRCCTVEWFEQEEIKGKEIDMATIKALNPDVRFLTPEEKVQINQLQRESSGSSEDEISAAMAQSGRYSDDEFNSNQFSSKTTSLSNPTQRQIPSKQANGAQVIPRPIQSQLRQTNNGHSNFVEPLVLNTQATMAPKNTSMQMSKRSNVVREVEKLKKNREERRQRQAEEKEAKEALMKMDPGNPHWELLNMIMEYRRGLEIKRLNENDPIEDHLITVCVRKRPLNKKEVSRKEVDVITIPSKNQLIIHEPKTKVDLTKYLENQLFRFDYAFDENCSNELVYKYTAQPLIKTVFEGGFATCFAYGQTGSGKTHTMGGAFKGKEQDCQKGIYALVASDVFKLANSPKYRHLNLVVSSSFFEIYSGKVFDLLNNKAKLRILEDGKQQVQVVGLTEIVVTSTDEVLRLIQKGNQARTSGQTFANVNSSRSHAVFQIYLRANNEMTKIHGKFSLIDLAGNERGADTSSANRQTRMEGAEINKSLLSLKECIRALGHRNSHLPFRVSKLTHVLRDSFVGTNSRTCMIAMISPGVNSCEYTLNTLRYADRVKELGSGDLQTNAANSEAEQEEEGAIAQLRSFNETDMPPEMLNFHQVVSELQVAEDNMLDNHKQTIEAMQIAYHKAVDLLQTADTVDYDQEAYCRKWKELLGNMVTTMSNSVTCVEDFMGKLAAEEQLSRKTTRRH